MAQQIASGPCRLCMKFLDLTQLDTHRDRYLLNTEQTQQKKSTPLAGFEPAIERLQSSLKPHGHFDMKILVTYIFLQCRFWRPCRLKTRLLGLRVRTQQGGWMSLVSVVYCQIEVSASGCSLVQSTGCVGVCSWSLDSEEALAH